MSERWPGGIVRATPVTPAGPFQNGAAPGMWSLADAAYWTKQGLWPIAGNEQLVVEDVFSTYLYTGNGSTQTITNGIDLAGKGGLVWLKSRNQSGGPWHSLVDTARGAGKSLATNTTAAQETYDSVASFSSSGFGIGNTVQNTSPYTYVSWTFREAANFFDVVTYTGTGSARTISHSLGSAPGCIIVKRTDTTANWAVYHRSNTSAAYYEKLNLTDAQVSDSTVWNSTAPTSSVFSVGTSALTNASGGTYVAYLFAHDTASTGCIQCGTFTAGTEVNLGWEPQWVMIKSRDTADTGWIIIDNMRTWANNGTANGDTEPLDANSSGAEYSTNFGWPTATGFITKNLGTIDCIYIAIRRGPMRTPTLGTSVFAVDPQNITISSAPRYRSGFVTDMLFWKEKNTVTNWTISSRLTSTGIMSTNTTAAEISSAVYTWDYMNGALNVASNDPNKPAWMFRRAPSFFDEVCYTGTGVARTVNHNLGVAPELMIVKRRDSTGNWFVYNQTITPAYALLLNDSQPRFTNTPSNVYWNDTAPTASVFSVGSSVAANGSGGTYVAYLFASCPGVSKVGTYTGTGTTQTINCGFTTGSRFVLIKRTDSTGDWYVWDSARGIVAGNDPYLLLNSTAAEVTNTDYIDTDNSGFQISSTAPAAINANGGTFIYLAIS